MAGDCARPIDTWYLPDILKADAGPAVNDIYGKMTAYLDTTLRAFLHRITDLRLRTEMYCVDVIELPRCIEGQTFDRIEVSLDLYTK